MCILIIAVLCLLSAACCTDYAFAWSGAGMVTCPAESEAWSSVRTSGQARASMLCRSAFLLCIGFNIILQFTANALGEEKIELIVDTLLQGALAAVPFAGSLH